MQQIGVKVDFSRPLDRAELRVDPNRFERRPVVTNGSEHAARGEDPSQVNPMDCSIREGQPDP
ncbi:MAG: hypothetical protein QOE38_2071, partial [Thermoleophilaceae bacterium]|nr:hypothetical protein [Thermoleophilaceae bacterium]